MSGTADRLARTYRGRKISALRCPKDRVEKTVSPCGIVGRSRRSVTFSPWRDGRSFAPIGKQLVQLDDVSSASRRLDIFMLRLTAVIVEPGGILPAISNASTPRRSSLIAVLTGEEMKTSAVAVVALSRIVLVESIVLAGHNVNDVCTR